MNPKTEDQQLCTTTGLQLANRLDELAQALVGGLIPARIGHRLSQAVDRLEAARRRQEALQRLREMLDPDHSLGMWQLAQRIEAAVRRFKGVAYQRILSGHKRASLLDQELRAVLESGPTSARRIWIELAEL